MHAPLVLEKNHVGAAKIVGPRMGIAGVGPEVFVGLLRLKIFDGPAFSVERAGVGVGRGKPVSINKQINHGQPKDDDSCLSTR